MIGFIILRHVVSNESNSYWKECYKCIRRFYDNPILIVDDFSNEFLNEDIDLINCTVVYDTEYKGSGIALPYYYFHKMKPFDQAIIIHDTAFIQKKIDFELTEEENIRFIWSYDKMEFINTLDVNLHHLCNNMIGYMDMMKLIHDDVREYEGCFGGMCVIKWDFLDKIANEHKLFEDTLQIINEKKDRKAFEKLISLLAYNSDDNMTSSYFGNFTKYSSNLSVTYTEYMTGYYSDYPVIKVSTGR